jgi:hypothetical protein
MWLAVVLVMTGLSSTDARRQTTPSVAISGELRQWHKVTLTLDGPQADETGTSPNPFTDLRMTVTFTHESGVPSHAVPGYFAGDGNAANTSATAGNKWRAHVSPDKTGRWNWRIRFVSGPNVAVTTAAGAAVSPFDGLAGSFDVQATDKTAPDFRASGRLRYVGRHHLQFAGTGEYFMKAGPDSPETLLAYEDFDGTRTLKTELKTYAVHAQDWRTGDPTWKDGKGKGLIGALNYLSAEGMNSISFLPYNAGGDGDNVWPFVDRDDKFHYDVSKLDQWQIVFDHAQAKGIYLHFKLQEQENDDGVTGQGPAAAGGARGRGAAPEAAPAAAAGQAAPQGAQAAGGRGGGGRGGGRGAVVCSVATALDCGNTGPERRLYVRELVARFGYALALNWNMGEENTLTSQQQRAMAQAIREFDPYDHLVVVHTFPNQQEQVYLPLLGQPETLTGVSLQNSWSLTHQATARWVRASAAAGTPWVVANDEQAPAGTGAPPDPGYPGFTGNDAQGNPIQTLHDLRKFTLWGNIMAGGAGVEYYFGYSLPHNDLVAEDFRSRDKTWDYARYALDFLRSERIPFWDMSNADLLVGNAINDNSRYCLAKAGELYLVYLPTGGSAELDLTGVSGTLSVSWFDPRNGGALKRGSVASVTGGRPVVLGMPPDNPTEDWLAVVRRN